MTNLEDTVIPAATVVMFRELRAGPAELLMIERAAGMAFAAGALVFPGGRIDPGDYLMAEDAGRIENRPGDPTEAAARIAAIRETIEEAGIAIGLDPLPEARTVQDWRVQLKARASFAALLETEDIVLDLAALVPFARWCPSLRGHRRFDTRFYVTKVTHDEAIELDADEAAHHRWLTAEQAIEDAAIGRHKIIFPTMRNLERLARYPTFEATLAHLQTLELQTISPEIQEIEGQQWLCIPADAGYPVTRALLSDVVRP